MTVETTRLMADHMLETLVTIANDQEERWDEGYAITLMVHGTLVSGEIIPNWQWFEEQNELPGNRSVTQGFGKVVQEQREQRAELMKKERDDLTAEEAELLDQPPYFIHLRNCQAFTPQPIPTEGGYWRGRLIDVAGWSPGSLRAA